MAIFATTCSPTEAYAVQFCDTDFAFDVAYSRIYWNRSSSYEWSEISTYTWDFGILGTTPCASGWEGELLKWEKVEEYYELTGTY
jgi:nicotinamide riboside kinase